jgi:hypothetical protein
VLGSQAKGHGHVRLSNQLAPQQEVRRNAILICNLFDVENAKRPVPLLDLREGGRI